MLLVLSITFILVLCAISCFPLTARLNSGLPPGPTGLPMLGLLGKIPPQRPWLLFTKWGEIFGEITGFLVVGHPIILLNSFRAVDEVFNKRSLQYVDKPPRIMADLCDLQETLPFMDYGPQFRLSRKQFHGELNATSLRRHHPILESEARLLLTRLQESPSNYEDHVKFIIGRMLLRVTLGYEATGLSDPLLSYAERVASRAALIMMPGSFMVDRLPILKNFPSWFPGGGFKRVASQWRQELHDMVEETYAIVKSRLDTDTSQAYFMSSLAAQVGSIQEERTMKYTAVTLYAGGVLTFRSLMLSFFLAMVLNPDVQRTAQAEIDTVVESAGTLSLSDIQSLPYLRCLIKELMRWNPVAPLISRKASEDDSYQGHNIPAGATVIANVWAITHDSSVYKEPYTFDPTRFMFSAGEPHATVLDPQAWAFGFGRRVCPGHHLADTFLSISIASILAMFDISPKLDNNGQPQLPDVVYTTEAASRPEPFDCSITVRSTAIVTLGDGYGFPKTATSMTFVIYSLCLHPCAKNLETY